MTLGGWTLFWIIALCVLLFNIFIFSESYDKKNAVISAIISIFLLFLLLGGMLWWFNSTESGKRAMKTQESNFKGGITRNVKVYDAIGNLLYEYEGQFDISFNGDEQRILFDDEHGNRHVIYFKTGTVIVEELNEEGSND